MSDLKPCPFCESTEKPMSRSNGQRLCNTCGAESPDLRANFDWNSRPIEDALRARLEAAEEVVEAARRIYDLDGAPAPDMGGFLPLDLGVTLHDALAAYDALQLPQGEVSGE